MASQTYYKRGATPTLDQLFITTTDKLGQYIIDQIFRKWPALAVLLEVKDTKMMAGSEQIVVPLEVGENPNGGWISENESLGLDDYDPLDGAIYRVREMGYSVRFSRAQQRINSQPTFSYCHSAQPKYAHHRNTHARTRLITDNFRPMPGRAGLCNSCPQER